VAPSARFERATFSSAGRRSNPLSYEGSFFSNHRKSKAGRQGFEPWEELFTPQPLSRRPRSSTPAPPLALFNCLAEGEGFEPPVTVRPQRFSRPSPSSARPSLPDLRPVWPQYNRERGICQNGTVALARGPAARRLGLSGSPRRRPCRAAAPVARRCCHRPVDSSP
jgi:hypothetical protein